MAQLQDRAESAQLWVADRITAFAGSMQFVYLHAALFAVWMIVFEPVADPDHAEAELGG